MVATKKKLFKNIFAITLMALLLLSSIFSVTFAYLYQIKESQITINVAEMQTQATTQELSPEDLIAGKVFTKTISYNVVSTYDIYFRVYAISKIECYDSTGTNVIERSDLIDLTSVAGTTGSIYTRGSDNKFYYTATGTTPATGTSGTYSLNFTFNVSSFVSEDLFTNSNFEQNQSLTTTITYYFEYCQVSGLSDWSNFTV